MLSGKKPLVSSIVGLALVGSVAGSVAAAPPTPGLAAPAQQGWAGRGPGYGAGFGYQTFSGPVVASKALGMTADEIRTQRLAGKSLGQIADEKGVKRDTLVSAMLDSRKAILDARVKAGTLTQEQEDAAVATMKAQISQSLDRTQVGPNRPADAPRLGLGMGSRFGNQTGPQDGTGFGRGMGFGPRR